MKHKDTKRRRSTPLNRRHKAAPARTFVSLQHGELLSVFVTLCLIISSASNGFDFNR